MVGREMTDQRTQADVGTGRLELDAAGDCLIIMTRRFAAPPPLVFTALVTPALLLRWMHGPAGWLMVECDFEAIVGGRYRYEWDGPGGRSISAAGVVLEIDPPNRLVTKEVFDDSWTGGEVTAVTELAADGSDTVLTNTATYPSRAARDAALATGMEHGTEAGYVQLDRLLAHLTGDTDR